MPELLAEEYMILPSLDDHDRPPETPDSVHVSTIKSYALNSICNYGETDWEDGPARNLIEMGCVFEDAVALRYPAMEYHPGEIDYTCSDGGHILGNPDGFIERPDTDEPVPRIVEIKHTSRSAGNSADSDHVAWIEWRYQLASYLAMMTALTQDPWTIGEFWTMHTAGNYKSVRWPMFKRSVMRWTTEELMEHLGCMERDRLPAYHWAQSKTTEDFTEALEASKRRTVVNV